MIIMTFQDDLEAAEDFFFQFICFSGILAGRTALLF